MRRRHDHRPVGLAAALYHRGVPVVHLPTSLLAQVDASVGGKTAVNLPQGKNLVGAYWQPSAVLCDTDYLQTLPEREWTNGYGEIARCHFIGAPDLRELDVASQIAASVALKACDRGQPTNGTPACATSSTTATPWATHWNARPTSRCATARASRSARSSPDGSPPRSAASTRSEPTSTWT